MRRIFKEKNIFYRSIAIARVGFNNRIRDYMSESILIPNLEGKGLENWHKELDKKDFYIEDNVKI